MKSPEGSANGKKQEAVFREVDPITHEARVVHTGQFIPVPTDDLPHDTILQFVHELEETPANRKAFEDIAQNVRSVAAQSLRDVHPQLRTEDAKQVLRELNKRKRESKERAA